MTYYDSIASGYEQLHRNEQLKKLLLIKSNLDLKPDDLMLDVGCGQGFSAEIFDCKIIGLDPSSKLLKMCPFRTVVGVAEEIPFLDNYFDIVISVTAIHNFKDYKKGILEMKRVGSRLFVFSVLKKSAHINNIKELIAEQFRINKILEEDKDLIFFCEK
ncbi:MAG: class I SAM-dependent methyltransferase [Nanoarchaeota archaeon]|nr:class I SAM-dependent methyltransferase [Nanoarchaeota archaeon]